MITKFKFTHTTTKYIKGQWMDYVMVNETRVYLFGFIRIWRNSNKNMIEYDTEKSITNSTEKVGFKNT